MVNDIIFVYIYGRITTKKWLHLHYFMYFRRHGKHERSQTFYWQAKL